MIITDLFSSSYFPGHIHAFYVEYVYFKRRDEARADIYDARPAPGVYSDRVQRGGARGVQSQQPVQQEYVAPAGQGQTYGTI